MRDDSAAPLNSTCTSDVTLQSPINWTATGFFFLLGAMHLGFAAASAAKGRWGGAMSFGFGAAFLASGAAAAAYRRRLTFSVRSRRLRIRSGFGRLAVEQEFLFSSFHAVQLTLAQNDPPQEARIELLGVTGAIECPPTSIPRQQALFLAILLDVPLIKALDGDNVDAACDRTSVAAHSTTNSRYLV